MKKAFATFLATILSAVGIVAIDKTIEARVATLEDEVSSLAAVQEASTTTIETEAVAGSQIANLTIVGEIQFSYPSGYTTQLRAIARLSNGQTLEDPPVSWSTSNEGILQISETGLLRAIGAGEACVYAIATDGSMVIASCPLRCYGELVTTTTTTATPPDWWPPDVPWYG